MAQQLDMAGHVPSPGRAMPCRAFSNTDESTEGSDGGDGTLQHAMQLRDGSFRVLNFHGLFGWLGQCHDDTKRGDLATTAAVVAGWINFI